MLASEFLVVLQFILLSIIFVATVIIALMVYDIHKASKTKKSKKEISKLPVVEEVKCPKCGTPMKISYDGNVVDGYVCPKCNATAIMSKKEQTTEAVEKAKEEKWKEE